MLTLGKCTVFGKMSNCWGTDIVTMKVPYGYIKSRVGYVWVPSFGRRRLGTAVWALDIWAPNILAPGLSCTRFFFLASFFCSYDSASTAFKELPALLFFLHNSKKNWETVPKCPSPKRHSTQFSGTQSAAPKLTSRKF